MPIPVRLDQSRPDAVHMLGRLYENQDCSAARALELVGERWSLLILRDAMFRNFTRFSQFEKSLGLATNILAKRLDGFVAAGLMERRPPGAAGEPAEYLLTQKGLELKPVIIALTAWGDNWVRPGPVVFQTEADGQPVELQLRRVGDDAPVAVADVVARRR
jgi:DNA-binding HxlR family transcriptional regulator